MQIETEKGFTGIDIAIAVVVIFIFVSLIAIMTYNINSSSKEMDLKSQALSIAVDEIEMMKNVDFDTIKDYSKKQNSQYRPSDVTKQTEEIEGKEGFFRRITIEDYADEFSDKIAGLVKKVTVQIKYSFKGEEQTVELSTILSKKSN